MLWFTLCLIALSIIILRAVSALAYWKKRKIAYVKTWPLVGELKDVILRRRNLADAVKESYNRFPGRRYHGTHVFTTPSLCVTDVDLIKRITITDFDYFVDHVQFADPDVEPFIVRNLFALRGQTWRKMRNTLSPSFTGNKIRIMFPLITDCAKQLNDHFLEKDEDVIEIEAKDVMSRIAIDIIATTAFGVQSNSLRGDSEFYRMGNMITESSFSLFLKVLVQKMFPKISKMLGVSQFPKEAIRFFEGVIRETLKHREENNIVRPDMIHLLMQARKTTKPREEPDLHPDTGFAAVQENIEENIVEEKITVEDIVAQGFFFFTAGFEITSSLMTHICYELAVNPEVQERLQAEVDLAFAATKGELDYETLVKMKYLDMIVSETLRKWPLSILLNRECVRDYKIEASETHGEDEVVIERGVAIFIPVYGIHRDPKHYPDPDRFDPERFSDENKHDINPYAYLPFGIGPRSCIGSRLALLVTKVVVAYLLSKFDVVVVGKTQIPLVLSMKKPLLSADVWLGLQKRKL